MTTELYPLLSGKDISDVIRVMQDMIRLRNEDVADFLNLSQIFLAGRATARIPSGPTDVIETDNVGDVANDDSYEYKLVLTTGGALWDRRALDTSW